MPRENFKDSGFVPLYRDLNEWQWYKSLKEFKIYIHCILKANYENKQWQGKVIERGQFVTSIKHLSEETGLSEQNVRTAIKNLIKTGELTSKATNRYTVITVNNYEIYNEFNKQITNHSQTTNNQLTTTNNDNNINKENNIINNSSCSSRKNKTFSTTTTTNKKEKYMTSQLIEHNYYTSELGYVTLSKREYNSLYKHLMKKMPMQNDDTYKLGIDIIVEELDDCIGKNGKEAALIKIGCRCNTQCLHKFINQKFKPECISKFGTFENQIKQCYRVPQKTINES